MGGIRKYLTFFGMRIRCGLQYRTAALAGIATQFCWGFMYIMLYAAFRRSDPTAYPMTADETATYIWLQQAFLTLFAPWSFEGDLIAKIKDGSVAYELCRPVPLYPMWFCKCMATRTARALLRFLPILCITGFLPDGYAMRLPPSPPVFLVSLLSLLLAFLLSVALMLPAHIAVFFLLNEAGIRALYANIVDFCSGSLIPLPLLPLWMQTLLSYTPFLYLQNTPYLIYAGYLDLSAAPRYLLMQVFWLCVLIPLGAGMMRLGLRRVVIQGGVTEWIRKRKRSFPLTGCTENSFRCTCARRWNTKRPFS